MDTIKKLTFLFTAGIFLISFLALLLTGFNYMLGPIKTDIARFEKRFEKLEAGQAKLEKKFDQLISALKEKKVIKTSFEDGQHGKISL